MNVPNSVSESVGERQGPASLPASIVSLFGRTRSVLSSQKVLQEGYVRGPVIHLDGWSVCSDVKFISG